MKKIYSKTQTFQYLFSIVAEANIETIEKLRMAKSILKKAFPIVNTYELEKEEPVSRIKALEAQIQLFKNAGKEEDKKDKIQKLNSKKEQIFVEEIKPKAEEMQDLILTIEEIEFILNDMNAYLFEAKKLNRDEIEMFDSLYADLENATDIISDPFQTV